MFLERADVCIYCCKVLLCDSSGEYLNYVIRRLCLSGNVNSPVLYVRRLMHSTGNSTMDLSWRFSDLWGLFQQATQHIRPSPVSGGEASYS